MIATRTFITPYPGDEFTIGFISQKEWRWLIAAAFYFGSVGGGLFVLSVYLNFTAGMVLGFLLIAVLKNIAHFLYLGHPFRFYWAFTQIHRSWISRGLTAVFVFTVFGGLYVASMLPWFSWLPWAGGSGTIGEFFKIIAIISALFVMVYTAFVMAYPPSIPFWNNSMLPILFFCYGLAGGVSMILFIEPFLGELSLNFYFIHMLGKFLIITISFLMLIYFLAVYKGPVGAQETVKVLLYKGGGLSFLFDFVVLGLGLVIPLLLLFYIQTTPLESATVHNLLALSAFLELIGGFFLRFCLLRGGIYNPVY